MSTSFDQENLLSPAGLIPVVRLAQESALLSLADGWLSVPAGKGANAGLKLAPLVAGLGVGAGVGVGVGGIDDMAGLLRGGLKSMFTGSVRRQRGVRSSSFTFGQVKELESVASRFLHNLQWGHCHLASAQPL